MANKKSAIKKARRDAKVGAQNKLIKKELKKIVKRAKKEDLPLVFKKLDKAAKRGIFHKNKSARLKSRISRKFNKSAPCPKKK